VYRPLVKSSAWSGLGGGRFSQALATREEQQSEHCMLDAVPKGEPMVEDLSSSDVADLVFLRPGFLLDTALEPIESMS
jgi:hypothetical protein